jgi:hypothetical protein
MANGIELQKEISEAANAVARKLDADILIFNFEVWPNADWRFIQTVAQRTPRRRNLVLVIVTEGGLADSAFRMMRAVQSTYERITVVVPGWCKSAGTLMCIGAHELQIGAMGELGPLDVQIVKADEMDEQKSGVVVEAAFEKLRQEAFKHFIGIVRDLAASEYRVTLKTAFDIATRMTNGVVEPIYDKLDPVTIGEDHRSNRLALAYAERLNAHSRNMKRAPDFDAIEALLSGYPSHGFVIDLKEAQELFKNVKPISNEIAKLMVAVGIDCIIPRNRRQEQDPKVEYLNDETEEPARNSPAPDSDGPKPAAKAGGKQRRLRGNSKAGSRPAARNGNGSQALIPS